MSKQNTLELNDTAEQKPSGPVTCLGMTFENDEGRRAHFTEELRKKLQDPEFRKIEGFPIGSDEDILALSDPPYYTACPNPWIADFIAEWEAQKPEQPEGYHYHREPFAADVSEGKNDPIYNAHSYHTKVPHKAIMRYILHYTQPGDIVFDGFCGTGMTGVAAQMCSDREVVMSLGYQVKPDGTILQEEADEDGKKVWRPFSKLGSRRAVLNDLSPAATFIAYNYNTPVDVTAFEKEAKRILKEVEKECGWMYETKHSDGRTGKINFTIWSDVFICPDCSKEIVFWDIAVDKENDCVRENMSCPHCSAELTKRGMERAWQSSYDSSIGETVQQAKQVPVHINYSVNGKRFEKAPDGDDLNLIDRINGLNIPYWHPAVRMMEGKETRRNDPIGITHAHHFYTKRNLYALASTIDKTHFDRTLFVVTAIIRTLTKMFRWAPRGKHTAGTSGTLYVPSITHEYPIFGAIERRLAIYKDWLRFAGKYESPNICMCTDSSDTTIERDSVDYIFLDPPFGSNLNYSELNFLWESWIKVATDNKPEAIENSVQNKGANEYRQLMMACFKEAYRVLKPGRWMTVEFSNTKASVWNSIQTALTEAGFIVANVSALDKKQGSFKAVTTPTAVKQDLVISAYKPNGGFEERFKKEAQTEEGVWDFVRTHLKYLPVTKRQGVLLLMVPERDPRILFDQMIALYVRKGFPVPISSLEFQIGLAQRFIERDGMYFLPDQVAEYDRKKMTPGAPQQLSMFVSDEASAIQWLRQLIKEKPQTFSDINPQFMQQLGGWSKNEAQLDLRELLNQNFLCYDGKGPVPEQIHAYLSTNWKELRNLPKDDPTLIAKARDRWYVPDPKKQGDLDLLREKALLKEFEEIKQRSKRFTSKDRFRNEALRVGFKVAWQNRDYATIIQIADKIPHNVLEEDPKLLMWYDQAVTRMGGE
ncbi:DNA methyltransferase [Thiorhodovibrio frisius]|uniref:DNA modification methylase n=1 Tax=Thiorhodovibrio frisius TaxID=631362 RepID=H8YWJ1_9GAMM|nr:DNA methyltransferase [Thiorhodovibrio frisius]EIC22817.1 DNA modification methylase [Thiorhodovibrio frisius]WPL22926.1 Adenine specific DNA methylase Mod [Thiorhodovibrio frisius]